MMYQEMPHPAAQFLCFYQPMKPTEASVPASNALSAKARWQCLLSTSAKCITKCELRNEGTRHRAKLEARRHARCLNTTINGGALYC